MSLMAGCNACLDCLAKHSMTSVTDSTLTLVGDLGTSDLAMSMFRVCHCTDKFATSVMLVWKLDFTAWASPARQNQNTGTVKNGMGHMRRRPQRPSLAYSSKLMFALSAEGRVWTCEPLTARY